MFTAKTNGALYSPRCWDEAPGHTWPRAAGGLLSGPQARAPSSQGGARKRPGTHGRVPPEGAPETRTSTADCATLRQWWELFRGIKALSLVPSTVARKQSKTSCLNSIIQGHVTVFFCSPQFSPAFAKNAPSCIHPHTQPWVCMWERKDGSPTQVGELAGTDPHPSAQPICSHSYLLSALLLLERNLNVSI